MNLSFIYQVEFKQPRKDFHFLLLGRTDNRTKKKKRNKSKTMISELPHHSFAHFTLKSLEGSVKQLQKWDTSCLSFFPPSMLEWPHQVPAPRNGDIFPFSESHSQLVWFQHWSWKAMKLHMSEQTGSLRQTPQSFESKSARFVGHF